MSALELEHVGRSSLSGRTDSFDQPVIRLGRRPTNDVVFDPHRDSQASGFHAEIRCTDGKVVITDVGSSNGTFVNGRRIADPTELHVGDSVRLAEDGPEFVIKSFADAASIPPTMAAKRSPDPAVSASAGAKQSMGVETILGVVEQATTQERKRTRWKLLVVGLLAVGAIGAAAASHFLREDPPVVATPEPQPAPPPPPPQVVIVPEPVKEWDWSEHIARFEPSVYVIVARSEVGGESILRPQGTAWVAGEGVLATNAHVADVFLERAEGTTIIARSVGPDPHDVEITSATPHPGYAAFQELDRRYERFDAAGSSFGLGIATAFDVALLSVRYDDQPKLAPPLPIATLEQLAQVRAGTLAAMIGFPLEGKQGGGVDLSGPVASKDFKEVTRCTDIFYASTASNEDQFAYMYSLNTLGGASGSPVFARIGDDAFVVGLIASGDNVGQGRFGSRIMSGSTSYGPRADLVTEQLERKADERHAERMPWMEEQFLKRFLDGTAKPKRLAFSHASRSLFASKAGAKKLFPVGDPMELKLTAAGKAGVVAAPDFRTPVKGRFIMVAFCRDQPYPLRFQFMNGPKANDVEGIARDRRGREYGYANAVSTPVVKKGSRYTPRVYAQHDGEFQETRVTVAWFRFE